MIENHLHLIPEIERDIVDNKFDSLVIGLGPTGHLIPWIDSKILNGLRKWGCHDIFRVTPVDDLLIMDHPIPHLENPAQRMLLGGETFNVVLKSRPKRLWIYKGNAATWEPHLHNCVKSISQEADFIVLQRGPEHNGMRMEDWPDKGGPKALKKFPLENGDRPYTLHVSPTGMTTLAWREGCRRIGVIGVDCRPFEHHTSMWAPAIDQFFVTVATQAAEKGGLIRNLSPISSLEKFRACPTSSASSLEATDISATMGQSSS